MTATLAALAGCGLFHACAVDQEAEVQTYRQVTQLTPPPVFTSGQPLTLVDAVLLANAYNERLGIEGERYLQSLIERQRRAAALLPTLDLAGTLNLRENTAQGRVAAFDGGFNAQYQFFTGLSDLRNVDAGAADARARRWLLLDLREVLMLETARAYYSVLQAERLVSVLESSALVQQERLRDSRGRLAVGFARPLDVAQIESQASQTQVTLLDAQNSVARSRSALTLLTGVEAHASPLTDGLDPAATSPELPDLLWVAYHTRQDLLAARSGADSARLLVDANIGRYYPSIGLNLDYFLIRESTPRDLDLSSLISLNLPIFSAGLIEADVRDSWSLFRQRVLEYSAIRRQIRRDVETARADLEASRQRVVELAAQVNAATEALRQAEAAYDAGVGTNLERVSAQDQLLSAQLRQASEEFTFKLSSLVLERACGRLTQSLTSDANPASEPREDEASPPTSPFIQLPPAAGAAPSTPTQPATPH